MAWAPMLIVKVTLATEDATLILECKSLGGVNPEVDAALSGQFNRRRNSIHLCAVHPCDHAIEDCFHVNRVRWWKGGMATFKGGSPSGRRQSDKWLSRDEGTTEVKDIRGGDPIKAASAKPAASRPEKSPRAGLKAVPKGGKKEDKKKKDSEVDDIGLVKKDALVKKLKELKSRLRGPTVIDSPGSEGDQDDHSSVEDVESSPVPEGLTTGTTLVTSGMPGATKTLQERREGKRRRTKDSELALVASRGSTSKGYQGQLVGKALAVSQTNAEEKKKSVSSSSKLGATLAKILTKEVSRSKGKKKKNRKKEKKRKRKRRRAKGGDPGDGGDGDSSSTSPSSSGEIDSSKDDSNKSGETRSSDEELEAPLRKKSKRNPGSVLELLVSHAREQLDQSASVGVGREEDHYLTTGIKVMTYFQVLLKPKLGGSQALQREMHHLATAIDLLRQGRLGLLGDTLAARFLCLHQSILDGHWSAARHMEIFPMEEASAASTALLLKTRKHARLAAKALGADGGGNFWNNYGPGRKGKGKQEWQGGDARDGKGKGKKGAKGKNKKGKPSWWHDSERQGDQEWKDAKESKGDKWVNLWKVHPWRQQLRRSGLLPWTGF